MSRTKELAKNTAIISIGRVGTQLVSFFLLPLYTAKLATSEYGNVDFVTTLASFIVPVITMLMEESMFRFLIDAETEIEKKKIISQAFIFSFLNLLVGMVVAIPLLLKSGYELGYPILLYTISCVFIALANALSRGVGRISLYAFSNFICSVSIISLNIILILILDMGFWGMIIANVLSNIIVSLLVFTILKVWSYINVRYFDLNMMKYMLKYSLPLVPNTISWSIINVSDRLVIVSVLGASANGLYSVANKFPNIINTFYNFFNIAWRESSARILKSNDVGEFKKIYGFIKKELFLVTIMLISGIQFVYPFFINKNYQSSVAYVPILTISVYYLSLSAFYGGIYTAYKKTTILGTTSFVAAIVNVLIDIVLIKFVGIYAAAISTVVSAFYLYYYRKRKMSHYLDVKDNRDWKILVTFIILLILFYKASLIIHIVEFIFVVCSAIYVNKEEINKIYRSVILNSKK